MNNDPKNYTQDMGEQRQYEYAKEQEQVYSRQPVGNKEFVFSFAKNKEVSQKLKTPRSRAYMDIFAAIDMLSATDEEIIAKIKANMDEETAEEFSEMDADELLEEIMTTMREELEEALREMQESNELVGVLSKCYIDGCDVHAISSEGCILAHYTAGQPIDSPRLEIGRQVFHSNCGCNCVEVYTHYCLVINADSTVTEVKC